MVGTNRRVRARPTANTGTNKCGMVEIALKKYVREKHELVARLSALVTVNQENLKKHVLSLIFVVTPCMLLSYSITIPTTAHI